MVLIQDLNSPKTQKGWPWRSLLMISGRGFFIWLKQSQPAKLPKVKKIE